MQGAPPSPPPPPPTHTHTEEPNPKQNRSKTNKQSNKRTRKHRNISTASYSYCSARDRFSPWCRVCVWKREVCIRCNNFVWIPTSPSSPLPPPPPPLAHSPLPEVELFLAMSVWRYVSCTRLCTELFTGSVMFTGVGLPVLPDGSSCKVLLSVWSEIGRETKHWGRDFASYSCAGGRVSQQAGLSN